MTQTKICLLLLTLVVIGGVICSDESNTSLNTTEQSSRSGRKNNVYYSPPDDYNLKKKPKPSSDAPSDNIPPENDSEKKPLFPPSIYDKHPAFYKPKPKYVPDDTSMYKSASNVNWNAWKGDSSESSEFEPPVSDMKGLPLPPNFAGFYPPAPWKDNAWDKEKMADMKGLPLPPNFASFYPPAPWKDNAWDKEKMADMKGLPLPPNFASFYPPAPWKDNAWDKEKMAAMIMMMKDLQEVKPKPSNSFLSKLKDPSTLLLVSAIPISILVAAVLPSLMNNMMMSTPAVSTTATGNRGRMLFGNDLISPIIDGVSTFGYRALENPGCMQRIFCQVTKGSSADGANPRILQRALHTASAFLYDSYLDSYGVKDLFDSMSDGNCEKVPCTNFNLNDYVLNFFSKEKKE